MDSLPPEIVGMISDTLDTVSRIKFGCTNSTRYASLPSYKKRLTYPEYLKALESRDFMTILRSEDAYKWYMGEELNLPDDHGFVKYLRNKGKSPVTVSTQGRSSGVLYSYIIPENPLQQMHLYADGQCPDNLLCWLFDNGLPVSERSYRMSNSITVDYHMMKAGNKFRNNKRSTMYVFLERCTRAEDYKRAGLYGIGRSKEECIALGYLSQDHPSLVFNLFCKNTNEDPHCPLNGGVYHQRAYILKGAIAVGSQMLNYNRCWTGVNVDPYVDILKEEFVYIAKGTNKHECYMASHRAVENKDWDTLSAIMSIFSLPKDLRRFWLNKRKDDKDIHDSVYHVKYYPRV